MKTKLFLTGLALVALTAFANAQEPTAGKGNCKITKTDPLIMGKAFAVLPANLFKRVFLKS